MRSLVKAGHSVVALAANLGFFALAFLISFLNFNELEWFNGGDGVR
jgi:hypothetical protein